MSTVKAVALVTGSSSVRGSIQFVQHPNGPTHVNGKISGLSPGLHGFHIHALGDTTNGCNSTGPHFNPLNKDHGAPSDSHRHAGDLGNIVAGPDGVAEVSISDYQIPLIGQHSILGRAVVVHADPDDLGRGRKAGGRLALADCVSLSICGKQSTIFLDMQQAQDAVLDNRASSCGHELSKTTGNAGARVGCGIIGLQSSV